MDNYCLEKYDVVILGSNLAALCQARHLMLNFENLKVALIAADEQNIPRESPGQSLSEIANLFICKELGLYEYMIENHPPKFGLNFHWPKKPSQTDTLDDYYHIWTNRQPQLAASQINCRQFKADLQQMNEEKGVHLYCGRVHGLKLTEGNQPHLLELITDKGSRLLAATHLIKTSPEHGLISGYEPLTTDSGTTWVRVKNVDRTRFHSGYDPRGGSCSHYYASNYWLGTGHWVWMIPTDKTTAEVIIGITHDLEIIKQETLESVPQFCHFLHANHAHIAQILESGEVLELQSGTPASVTNSVFLAKDNFYEIPLCVANDDTFYAMDTAVMAIAIESTTQLILAQRDRGVDIERKRTAYMEFNRACLEDIKLLSRYRTRQSGHASLMSWRIYLESMGWFGMMIPLYIGKWHLNEDFIEDFLLNYRPILRSLLTTIYNQLNSLLEQNVNLGLMDCYRGDQLSGHYHTLTHFDTFWEDAKYEPGHCNVFAGLKATSVYLILALMKLQWQSRGWRGILGFESLSQVVLLLKLARKSGQKEAQYRRQFQHIPSNTAIAQMMEEFKSYRCRLELQSWIETEEKNLDTLVL